MSCNTTHGSQRSHSLNVNGAHLYSKERCQADNNHSYGDGEDLETLGLQYLALGHFNYLPITTSRGHAAAVGESCTSIHQVSEMHHGFDILLLLDVVM